RLTSDAGRRPTLKERQQLEVEFREKTPQINTVMPALFEPGGRVWFYIDNAQELWGYDGNTWIEHKATALSRFAGRCATRGELFHNIHNRFAGGKAWFLDSRGIHVFDGTDWS